MVKVNVYSLAKEGSINVAKNFKVSEFKCSDGTDTILIHPDLPVILQKIRDHFGKPVIINSAYRTEQKIHINGVTPLEVAKYAETLMPNSGGIGLYKTFTHVDVRAVKSRWNSTSGKEVAVTKF